MSWLALWLWAGLTADYPPALSDLSRFPAGAAADNVAFLRDRDRWLDGQAKLCIDHTEAEYWRSASADNQRRLDAWYALDSARWCAERDATRYHQAPAGDDVWLDGPQWLGVLRGLIGERAYERGVLPPVVAPCYCRPMDP